MKKYLKYLEYFNRLNEAVWNVAVADKFFHQLFDDVDDIKNVTDEIIKNEGSRIFIFDFKSDKYRYQIEYSNSIHAILNKNDKILYRFTDTDSAEKLCIILNMIIAKQEFSINADNMRLLLAIRINDSHFSDAVLKNKTAFIDPRDTKVLDTKKEYFDKYAVARLFKDDDLADRCLDKNPSIYKFIKTYISDTIKKKYVYLEAADEFDMT